MSLNSTSRQDGYPGKWLTFCSEKETDRWGHTALCWYCGNGREEVVGI